MQPKINGCKLPNFSCGNQENKPNVYTVLQYFTARAFNNATEENFLVIRSVWGAAKGWRLENVKYS
jgi:hypothetical protein